MSRFGSAGAMIQLPLDPLPKITNYRHSSMNPGTAMDCIDCRHNVF
jgi:hypothetical protein